MLDVNNVVWRMNPNSRLENPKDTDLYLAYNVKTGEQFELNETAFEALKMLSTEKSMTLGEVGARIASIYEIDTATAISDILALLESLEEEGLVARSTLNNVE